MSLRLLPRAYDAHDCLSQHACLCTLSLPGPLCSGHTTAASFVCGTLLFVLLPLAMEALEQQHQQQQQQQQVERQQRQQRSRSRGERSTAVAALPSPAVWALQWRWQLWGGAVALTACGRVLADKHWVSDTLAGACLGAALFGTVALVCGIRELGSSVLPAPSKSQQHGSRREQ